MHLTRLVVLAAAVTLLAVSSMSLTACGRSDGASSAVAALEKMFRSGDITRELSDSERIAFSRVDGFRRRGSHVMEAMGIQYRFVRVEMVELRAAMLRQPVEGGEPRPLVQPAIIEKVEKGNLGAIAIITAEVLPSKRWLEEHASDLVLASGGDTDALGRQFFLYRDGRTWKLAKGESLSEARTIMRILRGNDEHSKSIVRRELAKRLISDAPAEPASGGR